MPGFVSLNPPAMIEDGNVDGGRIAFKARTIAYTGVLKGEQIELRRTMALFGAGGSPPPAAATGSKLAIGPPPDGSDPSIPFLGGSRDQQPPIVLRRVSR
jgi:beta-galactosidase